MERLYISLGRYAFIYRWPLIIVWTLIVGISMLGAWNVSTVLHGGSSDLTGSKAQLVEHLRRTNFVQEFPQTLLVTMESKVYSLDGPQFPKIIRQLQAVLNQQPFVGKSFSYLDRPDPALRSKDGKKTLVVVGIKVSQASEAETTVPRLRKVVRDAIEPLKKDDPGLTVLVTGESAISYDLGIASAEDSTKAEERAIPITVLFLLLAFGALIASLLPILIGAAAVFTSLGLIWILGHFMNLSPFIHNVSTMIGLGIGIDYSLFLLTRFRESIDRGVPKEDAVIETVQTAGRAITYSGLAVISGFAALLFTNLRETVAIGIGGILVVGVSILLSVTLMPALLAVFGKAIEFPIALSSRLEARRLKSQHMRYTGARLIMEHPKKFFFLSLFILLAMTYPATGLHFAALDIKSLPERLEARQGIDMLEGMSETGLVTPIVVVLRTTDGSQFLNSDRVGGLYLFTQSLHQDRRLGRINSMMDLPGFNLTNYIYLYSNENILRNQFPEIADLFLSKDGKAVIMQALPSDATQFELTRQIAREMQDIDPARFAGLENVELIVGGTATSVNEVEDILARKFPVTVVMVVILTYITLMFAFHSFLLPLKAILMNALSVLAAYGAMVVVFQEGWGASLFGITRPPGAILSIIPIVLFTVVFGLSMDYEVFLISRIREAYDALGDNREATAIGLALTGGIITSAASIMVIVFGAFTFAEIILVKEMGFGLAVAVFVDATVVRLILVPSFMRLAGDWNWIYWRGMPKSSLVKEGLGQFEAMLPRREAEAPVAETTAERT